MATTGAGNAVIVERLDQLREQVEGLAQKFDRVDSWRGGFERDYGITRTLLEAITAGHTKRLDNIDPVLARHEKEIQTLTQDVRSIAQSLRALMWIGGMLVTGTVGWLVSRFLGLL